MSGHGSHCIVGNACWVCATQPGWIGEEGVETSVAAIVEINISAAVVGKDEVSNSVRALDWVRIGIKSREEPGIFGRYQSAGLVVSPKLERFSSVSDRERVEGRIRDDIDSLSGNRHRCFLSRQTYHIFVISM